MQIQKGIPVSPGVVIGPAVVLDAEEYRIQAHFVDTDAVVAEVERFHHALDATLQQIRQDSDTVSEKLGPQYAAIFGAHQAMLEDRKLQAAILDLIRTERHTGEHAVTHVLRRYAKAFRSLGDHHLASRSSDIFDIEKRLLRNLLGETREELDHLTQPVIVLARDLTPSRTASLDKEHVLGFATELGGRTSHTAIVARALEIPAVVGLGSVTTEVTGGHTVILDGNRGVVVIDPDDETLATYRNTARSFIAFEKRLGELRDLPAETKDGVRIMLMGNIEFPSEVATCLQHGADGIGLYRTEFSYIASTREPTERDHFEAYASAIRELGGKPVVFRTLDLGADKFAPGMAGVSQERNPFLGLRSIRYCLQHREVFKTQIRAILRASALGDAAIMFPMISSINELRQAKMIVADLMEDLEDEGAQFDSKIKVGIMVEVPSVAILARQFAREVDFFSLGTNDLVQYTLAVDRNNENVADLFNPADAAVLSLIRMVIKAADKRGVPVQLCGEMGGDPIYTVLLVGMGMRHLSVTPHVIPEIKQLIRSVSTAEAAKIARKVLTCDNAREATNYMRAVTRRLLPEVV